MRQLEDSIAEEKELEDLKLKKLRALLKHAYENVPYYHESFRRVGFRRDDLNGLGDL